MPAEYERREPNVETGLFTGTVGSGMTGHPIYAFAKKVVPMIRFVLPVLACLVVGACATRPPATDINAVAAYNEANDPLEPFNRAMYSADQALDRTLIHPMMKGYRAIVPAGVRKSVVNFTGNLRSPITFVHDVLQGEPARAGTTFARFFVNTFVGVVGLFDVGTEIGLPRHYEDFGQTLAVWGLGDGPFIYVPLFGPSTMRDGVGFGMDAFLVDPTAWYSRGNGAEQWVQWSALGLTALTLKDETMDALDELKASSIDPYASLRSAYRQIRVNEIRNGEPQPMEDFDDVSSLLPTPLQSAPESSQSLLSLSGKESHP